MKGKGNGNEELEQKVNILIEKISQEGNMLKRYKYVIKCEMLIATMEKSRKLEELQESKLSIRPQIPELKRKICKIKQEIRMNSDYDVESSKFIFSKKEIKQVGGINQYIKELIDSGNPEQIEAAQKIQENIDKRAELKNLSKELKETEKRFKNIDKALKKQNNKKAKEGKYLEVRKNNDNIFAKISNLINSTVRGVKEFWAEKKENNKNEQEKVKDLGDMQDRYLMEQERIRKEYEGRIKKLKEEYEQKSMQAEDIYVSLERTTIKSYEDKKKDNSKMWRDEQARKYQEKVNKITKNNIEFDENNTDNKSNDTMELDKESIQDLIEKYNSALEEESIGDR